MWKTALETILVITNLDMFVNKGIGVEVPAIDVEGILSILVVGYSVILSQKVIPFPFFYIRQIPIHSCI